MEEGGFLICTIEPKVEIDFFFAKGLPAFRFQDWVIVERVASDHRPIAVVITANAE